MREERREEGSLTFRKGIPRFSFTRFKGNLDLSEKLPISMTSLTGDRFMIFELSIVSLSEELFTLFYAFLSPDLYNLLIPCLNVGKSTILERSLSNVILPIFRGHFSQRLKTFYFNSIK